MKAKKIETKMAPKSQNKNLHPKPDPKTKS